MANSFVARTRVRGEIDYYNARWTKNSDGKFTVKFLAGPHKDKEYKVMDVAIAKQPWR